MGERTELYNVKYTVVKGYRYLASNQAARKDGINIHSRSLPEDTKKESHYKRKQDAHTG